jgi:hypothetical protein
VGRGSSSLGVRRVGGLGYEGQRLRSGAFAPDCPVVIFVTACGSSFRFPRAYRRPSHPSPPTHRTPPAAISRQLGRSACLRFFSTAGRGGRSCGARARPAARAAFGRLHVVLRRRVFRFACGCKDAEGMPHVTHHRCMPTRWVARGMRPDSYAAFGALHPSYD